MLTLGLLLIFLGMVGAAGVVVTLVLVALVKAASR
jgi:hypothetical protein